MYRRLSFLVVCLCSLASVRTPVLAQSVDASLDASAQDDAGVPQLDAGPPAAEETVPVTEPSAPDTNLSHEADLTVEAPSLPPLAEPSPESPAQDVEVVVVRGRRVRAEADTAAAVRIVDLEPAQGRTADLGEVLARTSGLSVRRASGLGSPTQLSLHGLSGEQVRFFLDGVPLQLAGYSFGFANVPLGFLEQVTIYRGVVPVALGSDALGGAVDLITEDDPRRNGAEASYQAGSFSTHRAAASGSAFHAPSGVFGRAAVFLDGAENDYDVRVDDIDDSGRLTRATLPRFHDGYFAYGAQAELGVLSLPWARQVRARMFYALHERELQSDPMMQTAYGEAEFARSTWGAQLHSRHALRDDLELKLTLGYTQNRTTFVDLSECRYDFRGRCIARLSTPGEVFAPLATDQWVLMRAAYARALLTYRPHDDHALRLSVAPTFSTQEGRNREVSEPDFDPLVARHDLLSHVLGLEHEVSLFGDLLSNVLFAKFYAQRLGAREVLPNGNPRDVERSTRRFGVGDSLRTDLTSWLYGKASYEYATRLPTAEETFGDGVLTIANLYLEPEKSHNVNLGLAADDLSTRAGSFRFRVEGFGRFTDDLIIKVGGQYFVHANVLSARALGVESAAGFTMPGDFVSFDGNVTWQDLRSTSSSGAFGRYEGDRLPNRPYLLANGAITLRGRDLAAKGDVLELFWDTRYVHPFRHGWESNGSDQSALMVPAQLTHALALSHALTGKPLSVRSTVEVQNLTNERVYDFYMAQRPGRSVFFKMTLSL